MDQTTQSEGLVQKVLGWAAHPFDPAGSAFNWILFVGLLAIAAWFWFMILDKTKVAIS